jgi:hypothetical protein
MSTQVGAAVLLSPPRRGRHSSIPIDEDNRRALDRAHAYWAKRVFEIGKMKFRYKDCILVEIRRDGKRSWAQNQQDYERRIPELDTNIEKLQMRHIRFLRKTKDLSSEKLNQLDKLCDDHTANKYQVMSERVCLYTFRDYFSANSQR